MRPRIKTRARVLARRFTRQYWAHVGVNPIQREESLRLVKGSSAAVARLRKKLESHMLQKHFRHVSTFTSQLEAFDKLSVEKLFLESQIRKIGREGGSINRLSPRLDEVNRELSLLENTIAYFDARDLQLRYDFLRPALVRAALLASGVPVPTRLSSSLMVYLSKSLAHVFGTTAPKQFKHILLARRRELVPIHELTKEKMPAFLQNYFAICRNVMGPTRNVRAPLSRTR